MQQATTRNALPQGLKSPVRPKLGEETVNGVKLRSADLFSDGSRFQFL